MVEYNGEYLDPDLIPIPAVFDRPPTVRATCLGPGDPALLDPLHKVVPLLPATCNCEARPYKGPTLGGIAFARCYSVAKCTSCVHNALCMRHCKQMPTSTATLRDGLLDNLIPHLRYEYHVALTDYEECTDVAWMNKWLHRFPARRQADYIRSVIQAQNREDEVAVFVKREVLNAKPTKGRLIQGYKDDFTGYLSGPKCKAFSEALARVMNSCDFHKFVTKDGRCVNVRATYASGMNSCDLARWMENVPSAFSFYERDGKAWDSTINKKLLEWELSQYAKIDSELEQLFRGGMCVKGVYYDRENQRIKFRSKYTRKSGHNDTSVGNSLINMAITIQSFLSWIDCPEELHILVMGDDLLVAGDFKHDPCAVSKHEASYGIVPEAAWIRNRYAVTFISGRWYPAVNGGYSFGPLVGRQLMKLFWTTSEQVEKYPVTLISSIAASFSTFFRGSRFGDAWCNKMMITSDRIKHDKMHYHLESMPPVDWVVALPLVYGLDITDATEFARFIERLDRKPGLYQHWVADVMIDIDTRDVVNRYNPA